MVALHVGLLVGCARRGWSLAPPVHPRARLADARRWCWQRRRLRWWCIATLGPRWNTRVVVVPGLPRVDRRALSVVLSHPNYVAVVIEGIALPLVHSAWITALVFTVLNIPLLTHADQVENAALATLP